MIFLIDILIYSPSNFNSYTVDVIKLIIIDLKF